jgi:RNA polymerase sigma-70 factor (ECF subfamily)
MLIAVQIQATKSYRMKADRALLERCLAGDTEAFESLVKAYERKVFGLIYQITRSVGIVEDLAQEVFVKVYLSLPKFRLEASFDAWLYRIVVNQCYDYLRKCKRTPQITESEMSEEEWGMLEKIDWGRRGHELSVDRRLELRQLSEKLLQRLPPLERSMMILKEIEEMSIEELARIYKTSISAVKLRLFRARNQLKKEYVKILGGRK